MKYLTILILALLLSCKSEPKNEASISSVPEKAEAINEDLIIVDFEGLKPYLNKEDDKTYIVNFWATWCAPCIKELPYFEEINAKYKNDNVEVILVSLDFPHQYDSKLKPFIKENNLQSKIVVLDDVDMNTWIPKVDENWDGAIPVTIIYNKDKREFYDQTFTYDILENELKQFLK